MVLVFVLPGFSRSLYRSGKVGGEGTTTGRRTWNPRTPGFKGKIRQMFFYSTVWDAGYEHSNHFRFCVRLLLMRKLLRDSMSIAVFIIWMDFDKTLLWTTVFRNLMVENTVFLPNKFPRRNLMQSGILYSRLTYTATATTVIDRSTGNGLGLAPQIMLQANLGGSFGSRGSTSAPSCNALPPYE